MNTVNNSINFEEYKAMEKMVDTFKADYENWIAEKEKLVTEFSNNSVQKSLDEAIAEKSMDNDHMISSIRDGLLGMVKTIHDSQLAYLNNKIEESSQNLDIWTSILNKVQKEFELRLNIEEFEISIAQDVNYTSRLTTANSLIQTARLINRDDSVISNEDVVNISEFMNNIISKSLN